MCLGIPGKVVELVEGFADQLALVDVQGVARNINIGMLDEPPEVGSWIVVHMGFAMEVISESEADDALSGLEMVGRSREEADLADQESLGA